MAYRAELEIGVKGAAKLEQLKKTVQSINQRVDKLKTSWEKIRDGVPTRKFGEVNKKLQKTTALQARYKALAAATEKRLKGQNSVTNGLLRLNKAVLNAARSEAQARGESVTKQRALNRELAKSQQYSRPTGRQPQRAVPTRQGRNTDISSQANAVVKLGGAYVALNAVISQVSKTIDTGIQAASGEQRIKALSAGFDDYKQVLAATERAQEKFNLGTIESQDAFAQLFGRLRPAGFALSEIETIFNGFNTAAALTGATARESAGALLQLTQALGAGFISGQEFNSVAEQAPAVLQAIAKEVDKPVGQLKQLARDGQLTSEVLLRALQRIEIEGADRLAEALDTPAQKIKNLQNRTEDLNIAFSALILPAVIRAVEGLSSVAEDAAKDVNKTALAMKTLNDRLKTFSENNPEFVEGVNEFARSFVRAFEKVLPFIGQIKTLLNLRDQLAGEQPLFANDGFIGPQVPETLKPLKDRLGLDDQTGLEGAPKAPKLPVSQAPRLQQQITRELLKQFDIKTNYMKLNMSELDGLDFQNTRLRERLQQEEQLLELQRQEALANSKYAADAELINSLFNLRKVSIQAETEAQIQQNLVSAKQLKIQEEITALRQAEETKNIERALTRNIEDVERMIASPFGGDEAEQIDLLVDQQRRYIDTTDQLKTAIAEQKKLELIDTSGAATKQREALEAQLSIYEKLLPQLNALEQAELRQNQLMEKYGFIANEAATAMSSAVQSVITGTGSVEEAFSQMFANIGKAFLDMATQMIAKALIMKALNILGSAFSLGSNPSPKGTLPGTNFFEARAPGLATGGTAKGGQPYIVGEKGPELFIPGVTGTVTNNDQFEAARDALATGSGFTAEEEETIEKLGTTQQPSRLNEVLRDSRSAIESISRISKERETAGVNKLVKELGATSGGNGQTISTFGSSTTNNLKERLGGDSTVEKIIAAAQQTAQAEAVSAARDALTQSGDEQNTDSSELKTSRDYIEKVANNLGAAGTNTVNNVSSSSTFGESRSTVDRITAINQTRQMLESVSSVNKERSVERAMENTASGDIKPIDVRYESQVINNVEYVTAEQHRAGVSQAAERGRALALQALQNSVKTRKRVGL